MNLGETIYRLRTEKNMSQGDLAEALEVSRQSVSKWENGNSTPDLDKLVKMAKLFGVTLDELVTGSTQESVPSPPQVIVQTREPLSAKKIIGIVLLCFGLVLFLLMFWTSNFTALITCLIYAAPILLCGILCLKTTRNTLLYCILLLYFWLWLPMGIFAPNYLRGDFAKGLQSLHIIWGVGLIFWGWKKRKRGNFCAERRNTIVYFGTLAASVLLSCLFLRFPGLLPTPRLFPF